MINVAFKQAENSKCRSKHGAVVANGRRIFGMGCNSYKTHATYGGGPLKTLHAEAAAIRDAKRKGVSLRGKDLYVVRINRNQMSRPCKSCTTLIKKEGIRRIYYTDAAGNILEEYPPS